MTDKNFYCFTCKPKGRGVPDVGREHCVKCNDEFCFDCFYGNGGYSCDGAGCEKVPLCGACGDYHAFCNVCNDTFCSDCFAEKKLGNYCYDCGVETCGDCTKGEFSECEHCEDRFCQACRVKKGVFCSSATCGLPIHPVSYDFVQDLFLLGAKFDAVDSNGRSALHHAAMEFERDSCRLLISLGLDPVALDNSGSSALDCLRVSITDIDGHIDDEGKEAVVQRTRRAPSRISAKRLRLQLGQEQGPSHDSRRHRSASYSTTSCSRRSAASGLGQERQAARHSAQDQGPEHRVPESSHLWDRGSVAPRCGAYTDR